MGADDEDRCAVLRQGVRVRRMRAFLVRLAGLFRSRERELAEEIDSHLELHIADNMRAGMNPEEARRAAILKLGGIEQTKEIYRERSGLPALETVFQDLRYGLRMLWRSPGFTAVAALSLALGIGANTAIFSVMDAFLLRMLPVKDPQQLVVFDPIFQGRNNNGLLPFRMYERLRTLEAFFSDVTAILSVDRSNVTILGPGGGMDPGQCRVGVVTGNFFETLGVPAAIGRAFGPEDDVGVGGHPVVVISYAYWDRKFARDPNILGRTLKLSASTYTVIGVTPRGFSGEWVGRPTDLWVPVAMLAQVMTELPPDPARGGRMSFHVLARLRPGARTGQAQAAAHAIHQEYIRETSGPAGDLKSIATIHLDMIPAARGFAPQRQLLAQPLTIISMMVGLVLLIACANLANLLLARSASRQREITVRLAIGARGGRIVRQLLTESVLLSGIGGILGLLFAWPMANTLASFAGSGPVRRVDAAVLLNLQPDVRVLLFTLLLCLATGILFGLAPAIRASRTSIAPGLGERGSVGGASGGRLGKLLMVLQVALSVFLLIGAGLFVRTLRSLKSQDLGFDRTHIVMVWIAPGQTGRWGAAAAQLYGAIEQRISAIPGVVAVSPTVYGMLQGNTNPGATMNVPGYVPASDADTRAQWSIVGTGFFDTVGLRLIAGRNLTDLDTVTSPQVAILNQSMARHFFGNENPLGKHFESWGVVKEVVGVVKDAKYESPREEGQRMFYLPYRQQLGRLSQSVSVAIRTSGNPNYLEQTIRRALGEVDPRLPVLRIETVEDQLDALLVPERATATFSLFFGGLAALLASIGLYGVMAYNAARRTNEIGIRLALGASRGGVLGMIMKEALILVGCGILLGVPAALAGGRMISARLFGVHAMDPLTIAATSLLMIGVAALAGFLPALRASKVDPMGALRHE
jgi:predicted permease